jgi:hypothetical protein
MNAKDLENYIRANTVAIAALIESGELPIDTQGNIVSLTSSPRFPQSQATTVMRQGGKIPSKPSSPFPCLIYPTCGYSYPMDIFRGRTMRTGSSSRVGPSVGESTRGSVFGGIVRTKSTFALVESRRSLASIDVR